jgi:uncharacterized protein
MFKYGQYIIPYLDKFIIYQPLNKFAFIGNTAMVKLIEALDARQEATEDKNWEAISFLKAYGFFNRFHIRQPKNELSEYKPTVCVLCLTSACNFHCSYCFANGGETKFNELSLETGKHAIDLVYQNACDRHEKQFAVSFHGGGEPTLPFEKLKNFTAYARSKQLDSNIELTSNGYWDKDKSNWILDNIDNLTLSFDGLEEIQNRQRPLANGKGTFGTIMKNIRKLDKKKSKYGIRLTVTNESVESLPESIAFLCKETGCNTFQIEPAFGAGRALRNNQTIKNNKLFVENLLKAFDIATIKGKHLYYSGARPWVITHRFCTAHDNALVVTPEGLLSSCYEISGSDHPLSQAFHFGHLTDKGEPTIDNRIRTNFQNKIRGRKELCKSCFCYWHCAGDCPAKTFTPGSFENTTFTGRCELNREITKELLIRYLSNNEGIYKG